MSQKIFSLSVAFLQQNFIAVLIGGALVATLVIWKVSAWKTAVDMDRDTLKDFIKEIRKKIDDVLLRLPLPVTVQSKSPITLTELGEKVANEIKVDEWIDAYVDKLQDRIEDKTNPYEIQALCFRYAEEELMEVLADKDSFPNRSTIKMSAYQNEIDLPAVLKVVGVKLRDKILRNFNYENRSHPLGARASRPLLSRRAGGPPRRGPSPPAPPGNHRGLPLQGPAPGHPPVGRDEPEAESDRSAEEAGTSLQRHENGSTPAVDTGRSHPYTHAAALA